jgi:hypothetical protein
VKRRLILAPAAFVLLAAGGGTGYHLAASDADSPPRLAVSALGASLPDRSTAASVVVGRTTDEHGQPHELVLNAPGIQQAWQQNELFAVLSGTNFSLTGDAAADDWRFVVKPSTTGDQSPLVVLKSGRNSSLAELASNPSAFAHPTQYNDDAPAASARLTALINSALSRSKGPDGDLYQDLVASLTDPRWTGVVVFNPLVRAMPSTVLGRPTGALAGTQVPAFAIGFPITPVVGDPGPPTRFFAIVDTTDDGPSSGAPHVRARFANSALASFQLSED